MMVVVDCGCCTVRARVCLQVEALTLLAHDLVGGLKQQASLLARTTRYIKPCCCSNNAHMIFLHSTISVHHINMHARIPLCHCTGARAQLSRQLCFAILSYACRKICMQAPNAQQRMVSDLELIRLPGAGSSGWQQCAECPGSC